MSFPTVAEDGQKAELIGPPKDQAGQPFADAAIECYDFGAKAELRVTCVLKDGREVIGLIKDKADAAELVRLPKRAPGDWIAAKWREDNQAGDLPASDDEEKVAGQPLNGDGFTLYEEYRGWIENGRHITGDPMRKDFFVFNGRGADFRGGIALFERLSQLRVHSRLRSGLEIDEDERTMNKNHRAAPHRVDQHGVVLAKDHGFPGGYTVGVDGADRNKAFRPRFVLRIYLEWSEAGRGTSAFAIDKGVKVNLSTRDAELAWDRAVAHELLHAVGVDHHGERVHHTEKFDFQGPNAPLNPTGRSRYVRAVANMWAEWYVDHPNDTFQSDSGPTLTLKWEDTERDLFADQLAAYEKTLAELRASNQSDRSQQYWSNLMPKLNRLGKTKEFWMAHDAEATAAYPLFVALHVGEKSGTDSGHDLCVMKYYFAEAYEVEGQPNSYYVIPPGTTHAGREICHSPAGTGTNASSRGAKNRFGDAKPARGDCFAQICPNDAIPPRSVEGGY